MSYTPKYISIDDIPVQVPVDDYSEQEKADAIEVAESSMELDVNDGVQLTKDQLFSIVIAGIKQKATCELIKGASHQNSIKLGDIEQGDARLDLAENFCDSYEEIVAKINKRGLLDETGTSMKPYSYTTRKP